MDEPRQCRAERVVVQSEREDLGQVGVVGHGHERRDLTTGREHRVEEHHRLPVKVRHIELGHTEQHRQCRSRQTRQRGLLGVPFRIVAVVGMQQCVLLGRGRVVERRPGVSVGAATAGASAARPDASETTSTTGHIRAPAPHTLSRPDYAARAGTASFIARPAAFFPAHRVGHDRTNARDGTSACAGDTDGSGHCSHSCPRRARLW
jgi:hypothetical protein